jgi:hypothetical protein
MPQHLQPMVGQIVRWLLIWLGTAAMCLLALPYVAGLRAGLLEDDSYFYAQIAYNFAQHHSFTFDGINTTSGFHILWGLILSAISTLLSFVTTDKAVHLSVYIATWLSVILGIGRKIGRSVTQRWVFVGVALLTAPLMETALLTLLLILLLERLASSESSSHLGLDWSIIGLSVAVPLTRVDATLITVVWMLTLFRQPRRATSMVLGIVLGILCHLSFLMLVFEHPYTVSSLLKTQSVGIDSLGRSLDDTGVLVRSAVTGALVLWGASGLRAGRTDWREWLRFSAPVAFTVGHLFVGDMRSWYFLPGMTFAFWGATKNSTLVAGAPGQSWRYLARVVYGATFALTLYKAHRFVPLDRVRAESWRFAEAAQKVLPHDARVYQVDGSGFTGFWIRRPLVNGDGLMNTYRYAEDMKARRLGNYLADNSICYIITDAPVSKRPDALLISKGGLRVARSGAEELLRSGAYGWSRNPNAHFILWRLTAHRCRIDGDVTRT